MELQRSIFDEDEEYGEIGADPGVNVEFSQDDIDYLQSLDEKLSGKKLTVKAQPFTSATLLNHLESAAAEDGFTLQQQEEVVSDGVMPFPQTSSHQRLRLVSALPESQGGIARAKKVKWTRKDRLIEKLSQNNKAQYMEIAETIKRIEEQKECTFKPKVNQTGKRYEDVQVLFERLHEDHARREHNTQVKRDFLKTQDVPTFSPVLVTAKGTGSPKKRPGLYEKLYQDFDKMQRKKLKQKYDHEA